MSIAAVYFWTLLFFALAIELLYLYLQLYLTVVVRGLHTLIIDMNIKLMLVFS